MRCGIRVLLAGLVGLFAAASEAPQSDQSKVNALIEQLGADDFMVREAASKALAEMGAAVLDKLLASRDKTNDAEPRARLDKLIAAALSQPLGHWLKQARSENPQVRAVAASALDTIYQQNLNRLRKGESFGAAGSGKLVREGQVLAVKPEAGLLMLDVGKQHGVEPGMVFSISRDGAVIASARIDRVYPDMASGKIIPGPGNKEVQVNDTARCGGSGLVAVRPEAGVALLALLPGHGVTTGTVFTILRDGKEAGEAKVEDVYAGGCALKLIQAGEKVELQGDESFKLKQ